jgi:hypothetical protein
VPPGFLEEATVTPSLSLAESYNEVSIVEEKNALLLLLF